MDQVLWPDLSGKRVLLAVTGGIAAYKAAHLCRLLVRAGALVRVAMTDAAAQFVTPLTFAALSDNPVSTDLFDPQQESQIGHIDLADSSDLLMVAPATANTLAKLARGIADDLVSTTYLAFSGPVLLAPAMNVRMWNHPATRENLEVLLQREHHSTVGPGDGEMACGHVGAGRMAEPEEILQAAGGCLAPEDLLGRRILVSAGGTREALDPVRYLGNRSSGKMGFALAAEAASRGARVTLVSGPSALATPLGVARVDVRAAAEMAAAVKDRAAEQDAVIMAAAVADYRPADAAPTKIKKETTGDTLTVELERTEDILAALGRMDPRPRLVGFAAETTDDLDAVARAKMARKGCDLLVANDVRADDAGFGTETNHVVIYGEDGGAEALEVMPKRAVAARILERLAELL